MKRPLPPECWFPLAQSDTRPGLLCPFCSSLPFVLNLDSFTKSLGPKEHPVQRAQSLLHPACHMPWTSKSNSAFLPFPFGITFLDLFSSAGVELTDGGKEPRRGRTRLNYPSGNDGNVDKKYNSCSYKWIERTINAKKSCICKFKNDGRENVLRPT